MYSQQLSSPRSCSRFEQFFVRSFGSSFKTRLELGEILPRSGMAFQNLIHNNTYAPNRFIRSVNWLLERFPTIDLVLIVRGLLFCRSASVPQFFAHRCFLFAFIPTWNAPKLNRVCVARIKSGLSRSRVFVFRFFTIQKMRRTKASFYNDPECSIFCSKPSESFLVTRLFSSQNYLSHGRYLFQPWTCVVDSSWRTALEAGSQ